MFQIGDTVTVKTSEEPEHSVFYRERDFFISNLATELFGKPMYALRCSQAINNCANDMLIG